MGDSSGASSSMRNSSGASRGEVAETGSAFHGWKYKHYFVLVSEDEKNLRFCCTLCGGNKTLSSAKNTTSNLKKHLNSIHKNTTLVAKEVDKSEQRKRRLEADGDGNGDPKRQCTLPAVLNRPSIPANKLHSLLAGYVIEDMQPLSTVESPAFRKLIGSICPTQLPDRKSFTVYLDTVYDSMVSKVKETLEAVDIVSTTVDVWTAHHRSYLGMTAHWIDPQTLRRCKAAIACARMTGRHTYDALACKIEQVHSSYNLNGKVCATITDNGSNFVKAFAVYSDSSDSTSTPIEDPDEEREEHLKMFMNCLRLIAKKQILMTIPPRCSMSCHHIIGVQHTLSISLQAKMQINSCQLPQHLKVFTGAPLLKVQLCGTKQVDRLWHLIL